MCIYQMGLLQICFNILCFNFKTEHISTLSDLSMPPWLLQTAVFDNYGHWTTFILIHNHIYSIPDDL